MKFKPMVCALSLGLFLFSHSPNRLEAQEPLKDLDELVQQGLKSLDVPGVALAIVKDNQLILAKGWGYRDIEKGLPMDEETLLAIGSSTKAFTTFTLALLRDQAKLDWDSPVQQYIPWFTLHDRVVGSRITPRDLVTHRSGLPRHDLVWYNNNSLSREEMVRRLAHLEATADLRNRFQYNNLMFLAAGHLIETLTGQSWEGAVQERIFTPLGMHRSNSSVLQSQKDPNHALPYSYRENAIKPIPFRVIDAVGPAGSINSCARDMGRWLLLHLGQGTLEGKELINAATLADLHTPHMPLGTESNEAMIQNIGYAMGWLVDSYRGHRRIHHGGAIDGFIAQVAFLPQNGIGVVALANQTGTPLPETLTRCICDRLIGLEPHDWIGEAAKEWKAAIKEGAEAQKKGLSKRMVHTRPAHQLDQYIGIYSHPGYGKIRIEAQGKGLSFRYNDITTPLEHWHYEVFNGLKGSDPTFEGFKLNFGTDLNGRVAWVEAQMESTLAPMRFTREAEERFFDSIYLATLSGRYEMSGQVITVSLKGATLYVNIPGRPEQALVPIPGGEFVLSQRKAISLKFTKGKTGRIEQLELYQMGSLFVAKRLPDPPK